MTTKPPTPQGISALLRRAGFDRSVSRATRIKGWRESSEGYMVTGYRDEVTVRHMAGFGRGPNADRRKRDMLAKYAEAIRAEGWAVAEPAEGDILQDLIVTAGD